MYHRALDQVQGGALDTLVASDRGAIMKCSVYSLMFELECVETKRYARVSSKIILLEFI